MAEPDGVSVERLLDRADTVEVLAALQTGAVSSVELLNAQLDRIDIFNPSVNAVVAFDVERAMAEAEARDAERAAGTGIGALHGLPMTVKDCYETDGLVTTAGAPELANFVPGSDADLVTALRNAGAIIYGKTNVPLYAGDHQTYNDVYGVSRNPWDPDRTPGGSSGGAAAALACGFTTAEIGSDIGGSIRVPAHFNGVFGLKPSYDVLSDRGHVPAVPDLAVMGPLGRSIADLRLLTEVLVSVNGFGGVPHAALPTGTPPPELGSLRIGLWADDPESPVSRDVAGVVSALGIQLESAGAIIEPEARPGISSGELHDVYLRLLMPVMAAGFPDELFDSLVDKGTRASDGTGSVNPSVISAAYSTMRHRDWMRANDARAMAQVAWDALFDEVDVVIAPVSQTPAFAHNTDVSYNNRVVDVDGVDRSYAELLFWAGIATMPLLPSVAVPAGTIDGLPCGVQIIGRRWSDLQLLDIAELIGTVAGIRFVPPPLVTG